MEKIITILKEYDALRENDSIAIKELPSIEPEYEDGCVFDSLSSSIKEALISKGISRLYKHQAEAISLSRSGKDVILESPTASGKTLCFYIPLIEKLIRERDSYGLIIHPMKALSNDQRRQFNEISENIHGRRIETWIYDGDTTPEHRELLRKYPPAILFTNPEMLHLTFLGHHNLWRNFLKNLNFVIIDEIHEYRGYFGTNCSCLFRRFFNKLKNLGANPQLFLATATCSNSLEHAKKLTGRDFSIVKAVNNFRPHRYFAFITPDIPDFKYYDIFKLRVTLASLSCLSKDLSTIVFCNSRKLVEELTKTAKKEADKKNLDKDKIAPYRAGYMPDDRRDIEDGMRDGRYKIIFTTNALEIGIDVGKLDVCILAGFPDNIMSAWQRIGRTGRSWDKDAYTILYALNNAYDRFFAENIDSFLNKPLDEILIGTENEEIIKTHIPFLLHESDWRIDSMNKNVFGETYYENAIKVIRQGNPVSFSPNYKLLGLRGGHGSNYKLMCNNKPLGEISDLYKFREAYIGALYNHLGKSYKVVAHGANEIILESYSDPHHKTEPIFYTVVSNSDIINGYRFKETIAVYYGKLVIIENYRGYRLINEPNDKIIEEVNGDAAKTRNVHAFWLSIDNQQYLNEIENIKVCEQFLRLGTTFIIPCDRHDISTYSKISFPPSSYIYEVIPGGIGIAEKTLKLWRDIIKYGMNVAQNCSCYDGCPKCIYPPLYRHSMGDLSKKGGLKLTEKFLNMTSENPTEQYDRNTHSWIMI